MASRRPRPHAYVKISIARKLTLSIDVNGAKLPQKSVPARNRRQNRSKPASEAAYKCLIWSLRDSVPEVLCFHRQFVGIRCLWKSGENIFQTTYTSTSFVRISDRMTAEITLTGVQTAAAIAAAIATFYAARMAQRSAKASEISAAAAADAATASHRAVNLSQEQFKHSARPYVIVENVDAERFMAGLPLVVRLSLRNAGNTPALAGRVRHWFNTTTAQLEAEPPIPDEIATSTLLIGPQATVRFTTQTEVVTPAQANALERNEQVLYLSGIIDYADAFKDEHQTCFCFRFIPESTIFTTHTHYNTLT